MFTYLLERYQGFQPQARLHASVFKTMGAGKRGPDCVHKPLYYRLSGRSRGANNCRLNVPSCPWSSTQAADRVFHIKVPLCWYIITSQPLRQRLSSLRNICFQYMRRFLFPYFPFAGEIAEHNIQGGRTAWVNK